MRFTKRFKQAMHIGNLFGTEYCDTKKESTYEWNSSEECSTFCREILDRAEKEKIHYEHSYYKYKDAVVDDINLGHIPTEDHMWDEICKGFLAGEILGDPTKENLDKVRTAEKLWENPDYGYYQEVLEECISL